jgi:uncharacterized membrane protein
MDGRLMVMAVCALVAIAFVALGVPLVRRSVPPNWVYGFRLPQTVNDPALWYPANEYAGRWMIAIGIGMLAAAVAGYFTPLSLDVYAITVVAIAGGGAMAMLVACLVWLTRRLRSRSTTPGTSDRAT